MVKDTEAWRKAAIGVEETQLNNSSGGIWTTSEQKLETKVFFLNLWFKDRRIEIKDSRNQTASVSELLFT